MGADGTPDDADQPYVSRRGFLRLAGIGLVALYVKPTAVLAPEVEDQLLRYDQSEEGVACIFTTSDLVAMDEITSILKQYYMPLILEQIFTESPVMRYLREHGKI